MCITCVNSTLQTHPTHSTLLVFWTHRNVAVWAAVITLFVYTRHSAMVSTGNCYVSTTITWRTKHLFCKWFTFLTISDFSIHTVSDVSLKWSHFSCLTTWYMKRCLWVSETSWPILVLTFSSYIGSRYHWHCTITTADSTIHFSSCLQEENTDYFIVLFKCTCVIYWCSETVSHVTPCAIFNCDVSRPHTTALSITMLYDSHVPI